MCVGEVDVWGESGISVLDQLSEEHRELIRILVELQDKYELPKEEDIKQLSMVNI